MEQPDSLKAKSQYANNVLGTDNPDFLLEKDCPQARGADTQAGIIANSGWSNVHE